MQKMGMLVVSGEPAQDTNKPLAGGGDDGIKVDILLCELGLCVQAAIHDEDLETGGLGRGIQRLENVEKVLRGREALGQDIDLGKLGAHCDVVLFVDDSLGVSSGPGADTPCGEA